MKKIFLFAISGHLLTACNNADTSSTATTGTTVPEVTETRASQPEDPAVAVITLNAGDDMKFDLAEIKVNEGQTVKLTLNHTGKMAKTAMGHNFILLAQGADLAAFATAAINSKETDYLPAGKENDIIAHTRVVGGGESDSIEFTAPAKGHYEFLCSFPGHSAMMKGIFTVE
ncbi:azurin [Niabella yanshanensis]|uniref:Azurin n=1 Tax=Niabella yanshanensis TaxID=577386 RepID=A0ABZ0WAB7_9BACT|nr:azurin [Niabella yanshanensis]WQD40233.1 azurin [Niabella yanshanensis]